MVGRICNFSSKNDAKNAPTIAKMRPKIHPKVPKIDPKRVLDAKRRQEGVLLRFFVIFVDFWSPLGLPKWSPNREKSSKNAKKTMLKKETFSNTIF